MLGESHFLTIFFRIANVLVLAGLAYYIYRKYFKYRIEEKVNQKEALFKGLEEQGYSLEGRAEYLQRQLQQQEIKVDTLKEKIDEWQHAVTMAQTKRKQELQHFSQKAAARVAIKNETVAQNYLENAIMPEALKIAQIQLEEKYRNIDDNHEYVQKLLQKLSEAVHE